MRQEKKVSSRFMGMSTLLLTMFAVVMIMSGCSRSDEDSAAEKTFITVKGSDTTVHLVSTWTEVFMKVNPGI